MNSLLNSFWLIFNVHFQRFLAKKNLFVIFVRRNRGFLEILDRHVLPVVVVMFYTSQR